MKVSVRKPGSKPGNQVIVGRAVISSKGKHDYFYFNFAVSNYQTCHFSTCEHIRNNQIHNRHSSLSAAFRRASGLIDDENKKKTFQHQNHSPGISREAVSEAFMKIFCKVLPAKFSPFSGFTLRSFPASVIFLSLGWTQ